MVKGRREQLAASLIEVEPTPRQKAAYELVAALGRDEKTDIDAIERIYQDLVLGGASDAAAQDGLGRLAAARVRDALFAGREPQTQDMNAIRDAINRIKNAGPLCLVPGMPVQYWQGWLVDGWLPRGCVTMLTGEGGTGKSRLALQLAWAISGGGRWLGEAGAIPAPGANYGMGFEPMPPSPAVYATWEDSPEQINGRLYWMERAGNVGSGDHFLIADMRARGHAWERSDSGKGLTDTGHELRLECERIGARLLVIDTVGAANGASENDRAQVGAFYADWSAWSDWTDCTVLLVAHPPKLTGSVYSGSTGVMGGVRAMWSLERAVRDCVEGCRPASACSCEKYTAYKLFNAKQNYSMRSGRPVWLTNRAGVWVESAGGMPDYTGDYRESQGIDDRPSTVARAKGYCNNV